MLKYEIYNLEVCKRIYVHRGRNAKMRMLIVEDDKRKLHKILEILKPEFEYDVATCEKDAMQLAKHKEYEVLITDMQFPKEKGETVQRNAGVELIKKMKETHKEKMPKIIVYSLISIEKVWERLGEITPKEYIVQVVFHQNLEVLLKKVKEEI